MGVQSPFSGREALTTESGWQSEDPLAEFSGPSKTAMESLQLIRDRGKLSDAAVSDWDEANSPTPRPRSPQSSRRSSGATSTIAATPVLTSSDTAISTLFRGRFVDYPPHLRMLDQPDLDNLWYHLGDTNCMGGLRKIPEETVLGQIRKNWMVETLTSMSLQNTPPPPVPSSAPTSRYTIPEEEAPAELNEKSPAELDGWMKSGTRSADGIEKKRKYLLATQASSVSG